MFTWTPSESLVLGSSSPGGTSSEVDKLYYLRLRNADANSCQAPEEYNPGGFLLRGQRADADGHADALHLVACVNAGVLCSSVTVS